MRKASLLSSESIIWLASTDLYHSSSAAESAITLLRQSSDDTPFMPVRSCRMLEQILEYCNRTHSHCKDGTGKTSLCSVLLGTSTVGREASPTSCLPFVSIGLRQPQSETIRRRFATLTHKTCQCNRASTWLV